jgi:hypothetical protein
MLGIFSRLASGEEMPARDRIQPIRPLATDRVNRNRSPRRIIAPSSPRRLFRRLGWNRAAVMLWLLISVGLIAVAVAVSNRGPGQCVQSWGTVCTGQAPAHVARP